jgi:hypothetical protein
VSTTVMPVLESITVIGSGFPERTDPAALVIGPTGVGLRAGCDGDDCGDHDEGDQAMATTTAQCCMSPIRSATA